TINFPNATSITANAANITLNGSGAAMTALALASNSGTLALTNGASLSTPGDFSNSGTLTLGSVLTVGGNFTQTSAGTLNEQIGGSPSSGNFGQIAASGSATLAGNFNVSLVNGFTPVGGQIFPALKYTSVTGSFATTTGLPTGMTVNQQTATELDLAMPSAGADLGVTSATAPTTATVGQSITVNWQVNDENGAAATGTWQDSVYLSSTQSVTSNSVLLGSVQHTGGLAANGSYKGTLTAAVPAVARGNYDVLVVADSLFQVPDPDRGNNTLAATTGQLAVSVPGLTLGAPANGSFTAADQDQYYEVTVPAGGSLAVTLTSSANSGATALYVSQGVEPTPYSYQFAATANQPNETLSVPNAAGGTYYILVHSVSGAAASRFPPTCRSTRTAPPWWAPRAISSVTWTSW
ncbi:MAG TPA: CARDB domain-containing protein, partial [Pirellulales bacterium]|nr:CARDB domain-containing protein [Pirellulales bacterium]